MMVSKVAVIALVAIVACPILLGYAMNLSEVQVTEYKADGSPTNVTQLLSNDYQYSYVKLDPYTLNSQNNFSGSDFAAYSYPNYKTFTTTYTTLPLDVTYFGAGYIPGPTYLTDRSVYQLNVNYPTSHNLDYHYLILNVYNNDGNDNPVLVGVANKVISVSYYQESSTTWRLRVSLWDTNTQDIAFVSYANPFYISYTTANDYQGESVMYSVPRNGSVNTFVDFSGGFTLNHYGARNHDRRFAYIRNTMDIRDETLTFDLGSETAASRVFSIGGSRYDTTLTSTNYIEFEKTTVAGVVSWVARMVEVDAGGTHTTAETIDLVYDTSANNNNTYQLIMNDSGYQLRYVGAWPTAIGIANYYSTYTYSFSGMDFNDPVGVLSDIKIWGETPTMRIDGATARSFYNSVIQDETYAPADFKTNPVTTIKNMTMYGSSIVFGGQTFTVNKGNITLGTHQVSVNGLVLESTPTALGYENKINGVEISTTANPSTIVFNGKWAFNITTDSQSLNTYNTTQWNVGSFGWNGIDENFLMVGLLTSLGVFIALGIYIRRTKANLWPLLVVCGGAAMLFFCML